MSLKSTLIKLRNLWHKDIAPGSLTDYKGRSTAYDSYDSYTIRSYCHNEFLIRQIGIEKVKELPCSVYCTNIHELTKVYKLKDDTLFCRIGNKLQDGGYVMVSPFSTSKIAYSIGISTDDTWDEDMANRGYDVFMYDHTIDKLPHKRSEFHWKKIGITGRSETDRLMTLSSMIRKNGHEQKSGFVLKMDVECAEWDVLTNIEREVLDKFDQIVIEVHDLLNVENKERVLESFDKLNESFCCVHIHPNNCGRLGYYGDLIIPDVMEMTWINKKTFSEEITSQTISIVIPTRHDKPCNHLISDVVLGKW